MAKFVCTQKCFHDRKLYRKGEVAEFREGAWPKNKKGEMIHFEALDGPPPKRDGKVRVNEKET